MQRTESEPRKPASLTSKVSFNNKDSVFFVALKKKVDTYFESNELKSTGTYKLYFKAAGLVATAVLLYAILVFFTPSVWMSLFLCCLLGANMAVIGFNIMHDAAHGSFSKRKWVNDFLSYSLNAMGGNVYLWKIKHNINHHTYTNISGMDDDIDIEPWIRTHSNQPIYWYHRFQFIYWIIFYGITYFLWIYIGDFVKYFSGKIANTTFKKMNVKEHIIFWGSKVLYTAVFIVLPIFMVGLIETIIGYGVMAFVCGLIIAVVFQLAHLTELAEITNSEKGASTKIEKEWAVHQISTTANFATKSRIISWLIGGLNFQVEHHLFPRISHIHYPQLNKLVIETCQQFNIAYNNYPTFVGALWSHVLYLKRMGKFVTVPR